MSGKKIYPDCVRENYAVYIYSEIAIENYYQAKEYYQLLQLDMTTFIENVMLLQKHSIGACVFAAMAMEAFLNDYTAACLGDVFFFENLDRLSAVSKFCLISKLVFHKEVDKSQFCYCGLKTTFSRRDSFVHSKSRSCDLKLSDSANDADKTTAMLDGFTGYAEPCSKEHQKRLIDYAKDAIKTLVVLSDFFDDNDTNIFAREKLLRVSRTSGKTQGEKYLSVLNDFGVKVIFDEV